MTDIVKKLRSPIDEKEDYFISQWPGEEPKTHDAVRFQAADEIERLRAALEVTSSACKEAFADNESLRLALEVAANDLDDWGAYTKAKNARAALEGK